MCPTARGPSWRPWTGSPRRVRAPQPRTAPQSSRPSDAVPHPCSHRIGPRARPGGQHQRREPRDVGLPERHPAAAARRHDAGRLCSRTARPLRGRWVLRLGCPGTGRGVAPAPRLRHGHHRRQCRALQEAAGGADFARVQLRRASAAGQGACGCCGNARCLHTQAAVP